MAHMRTRSIAIIMMVGVLFTITTVQSSRADIAAQPGTLDVSFCQTGNCTHVLPGVTQPTILDVLQYTVEGKEYILTFGRQNYSEAAEGSFLTRHTLDGALDPTFGSTNKNGVVLLKELNHPLIPAHTGRMLTLLNLNTDGGTSAFLMPILVVGSTEKEEEINAKKITRSLVAIRGLSQSGYLIAPGVEGWNTIGFTPADLAEISPTSPFAAANGGYVNATGQTIMVQPDKKIVVVAELTAKSTDGGSELKHIAVLRLDATPFTAPKTDMLPSSGGPLFQPVNPEASSLDTSFGQGGKVVLPGSDAFVLDSLLQSDGKILIATQGSSDTTALYRLESNGKLDVTFGVNGVATVATVSGAGVFALQPDGKILYAGTASQMAAENNQKTGALVMCRVHTDGQLDQTFGTAGCLQMSVLAYSQLTVGDMVVQENGKIVVAGTAGTLQNKDIYTLRVTPYGTLDSSFGKAGMQVTTFDQSTKYNYEGANALHLQKDGKIIVGGYVDNYAVEPTAKMILQRVYGDTVASADADGVAPPNNLGPVSGGQAPTTDTTPVVQAADVKLTLQGSKSALVGRSLLYSIFVENLGPGMASGIAVSDTLPGSVTLKKITSGPGVVCSGGSVAQCSIPTLAAGKKTTIQLSVAPLVTGTMYNSATVTSTGSSDPVMSNNIATLTTLVAKPAPPPKPKK